MSKRVQKRTTWMKVRKFFNDIHLWGGLISGIVVFIVCITGTIYTYNTELRALAMPEFNKVKVEGEKKSADQLLTAITAEVKGKVVGVKVPYADNSPTFFMYNKKEKDEEGKERKPETAKAQEGQKPESTKEVKEEKTSEKPQKAEEAKLSEEKGPKKAAPAGPGGGRGPRANQLAVNPYTGQIIGDPSDVKTKTAEFMQKMFSLHRWLLLNEIEEPIIEGVENRKLGSWITGSATLLFLFGVITGIVIWFPNKMRAWKNGLNIRWSANWKRLNHDLHNTLGFYSCIILFLMAVTGPFWSFDWYRAGWQKTWGTYKSPDAPKEEKAALLSTLPADGRKPMSIEETILAVNKVLPYEGDVTINFAKDSVGTVSISKNRTGFFAPSAGDRLTLDQYSGEVLERDVFREKPFNQRASASIKALHIGDIYGPFTKLLYFISCLIATSLPVTGVMIWINKMKKKKK
ncbi:PepSY-associated TM helix domain-containing protein [Sphingobacterium mizutaii]|uniref:PepSY-associated TM helix domain-containing protein n=1 Tax=Sphingobacterium mizutaii TaxID=1010 RepID=UPI00289C23AA|nr:PepSY-associated TM helix domain-containing protein [Sphingobacterium mizutaii]